VRALRAPVAFDGERFLDGGATVLFDDSRIVGVESAAYDVPQDCDLATYGGTLLPGLVDCYVHLVANSKPMGLESVGGYSDEQIDAVIAESLAQQAAAGVTTVRDLGDRNFRTLEYRDRRTPGQPQALATATSLAAEACGLSGVTGRLAAGLDADLLVVDGDVRAEPEALGRPVAVFLRGQPPG
jgi:imidazolonepropionase-like amidohydrolase